MTASFVLRKALTAKITDVVVIGIDKEGDLWLASDIVDQRKQIGMLSMALDDYSS